MNNLIVILVGFFICNISVAEELTRTEIMVMHKMNIRMALESEKPYIVPKDISPSILIKTELLDFSGKQLSSLPQWIKKFKNLRKIDLSDTGIIVNDALSTIKNYQIGDKIEILNMANGTIKNDKPIPKDIWAAMPNLRELNLSNLGANNLFKGIAGGNLIKLNIKGNNIVMGFWEAPQTYVRRLSFSRLRNLSELNLSSSNIDLQYIYSTSFPKSIKTLDISRNRGTSLDSSFGDLFSLPNLVQLKIDSHIIVPTSLKEKLEIMGN